MAKHKGLWHRFKKNRAIRRRRKRRGMRLWLWRLRRFAMFCVIGVAFISVLAVLTFRVVNPTSNFYIASETQRIGSVKKKWVPIDAFSIYMPLSVVAAEDANFCLHTGFDFEAIRDAIEGGGRRGASTISQQVAKNVFLWQGRSWFRKGLETGFTALIELFWPKRRILEVYLNIAEFDAGVFGAAAGAKHYFGAAPKNISPLQAARLAAVLPSPKKRSASRPTQFIRSQTRKILSGAGTIRADGRADCFLGS